MVFSPAQEKDGRLTIAVAHDLHDAHGEGPQVRVIAVDVNGREHRWESSQDGRAGKLSQLTVTFSNLSLKDVKTFRLVTRPYQWAEFRNVSLHPEQKSQAITPMPKSVPDPPIENPSAEPISRQDDNDGLHVADDTCFAAIRLPNTVTNPNHWRWKVHIPKDRDCELRFSAYDVPIDGIAKGEFAASEHRSQGQPITTHGEVVIEFAAFPNATGDWQYGLSVDGSTLFSGGFNTFQPERERDTSLSVGKATTAWNHGVHPVLLLAKYKGADVQRLGPSRPDSCHGFAVWIRDLKIPENEGVVIGSKPDRVFLAGISQQENTRTAWLAERGGKGTTKIRIGEILKIGDVSAIAEGMEERVVFLKVNGRLLEWKLGMSFAALPSEKEGDADIQVSYLWKTFTVVGAREVTAITAGIDGQYLVAGNTYSEQDGSGHWWGELSAEGKPIRETRNWDIPGVIEIRVSALRQTSDGSVWVVGGDCLSKFTRHSRRPDVSGGRAVTFALAVAVSLTVPAIECPRALPRNADRLSLALYCWRLW